MPSDSVRRLARRLRLHGLLEASAHVGRQGIQRGVVAVERVQLLAAHREERASLEHLDLDALLEHVAGRGHAHIRHVGVGEHLADHRAGAGLDAGLIDRAGEHVRGPEREGRGDRGGVSQPTRRTDPHPLGRWDVQRHPVAQTLEEPDGLRRVVEVA